MLIVVLSTVNLQERAVMFFYPPMIAVAHYKLEALAALTDIEDSSVLSKWLGSRV